MQGRSRATSHPFEEPAQDERRTPLSRATRTLLLSIACVAPPLPLIAQTNDVAFANWRANPLTVGSRPAGMGGAFVAVADDARAAFLNPAGLTQIPLTEASLSTGRPWLAVASGRRRLRLAAYYTKSEQEQLPELPGGPRPTLQPAVWEAGMAAGFQPFRHVRLGIGVAYRHLEIEQEGASTPALPLVGASDGQVRFTVGTLVDLIPARVVGSSPLKLGVSLQPGVTFRIPRPGSPEVELRRPSVASAGLAWRANNSWSFSGQVDFIRYQEVVDALRQNVGEVAGSDFHMSNAAEPRLGTEFATPLRCGCGTVKLRAGLHYESPGTLRYLGADPVLHDAFPVRSWRTTVTLGASFFSEYFGNAVRIDVDSRDVFDGPALSAGVVWRF